MRRRGYHQREHTRVNDQGTSFRAGQAMLLQQRPQANVQVRPLQEPTLVIPQMTAQVIRPVVRLRKARPAHYRVGDLLISFSDEEEQADLEKAAREMAPWLIKMYQRENDVFDLPEWTKLKRLRVEDRVGRLEHFIDLHLQDKDYWVDPDEFNKEELDSILTDNYKFSEKLWEVYDPLTGKATLPISLRVEDFFGDYTKLKPYEHPYKRFKKISFYRLTKEGFAVKYETMKSSPEWLYFLPTVSGFKRNWLYGGLMRL